MMLAAVARFIQPPLLVVAHQWLETRRGAGVDPQWTDG
jgi:hypothetical protein